MCAWDNTSLLGKDNAESVSPFAQKLANISTTENHGFKHGRLTEVCIPG